MNASPFKALLLMLLCCAASGLLPWKGHAVPLQASPLPPGGLSMENVPQFVLLGFDDNPHAEPMQWLLDFLDSRSHRDGSPVRVAFYTNGKYLEQNPELQELHRRAWEQGHEIGNHTQSHFRGDDFTVQEWIDEIERCQQVFASIGIPDEAITGFRTPFLAYNAATFEAIERVGLQYDSTIEEGYQPDQDGSNFLWPYTLHEGSPGNQSEFASNPSKHVASHPSLFEIPIHVFILPDDTACTNLGLQPGLRKRVARHLLTHWDWQWSVEQGKLSGLDWNVLEMAGLDAPTFLGILKHNLDLRRSGNKAPMMIGAHSAMYPASQPERRQCIEQFVDYALSFSDVRIVTPSSLIHWLQHPLPMQSGEAP